MTDLVQEEKTRDADRAAHAAALDELRSQIDAAQVGFAYLMVQGMCPGAAHVLHMQVLRHHI